MALGLEHGLKDIAFVVLGIAGIVTFGIVIPILSANPPAERVRPFVRRVLPQGPLCTLSRLEFVAIVAFSVGLFLWLLGPVWERTYDVDRAVSWSYVPIPLAVLWAHARRHKPRIDKLFLDTLMVAATKFGVTAALILATWAIWGPSELARAPSWHGIGPTPAAAEREPSVIADGSTGVVRGQVQGADGSPIVDAVVHVRSGLEHLTFAPATEPVVLERKGGRLVPETSAVQVGQPLVLRSYDRVLHTLTGRTQAGDRRFNFPMLALEHTSVRTIGQPLGHVELGCAVHGHHGRKARMLVIDHPFHTRTDDLGRFVLDDVPAGELEVTVMLPNGEMSAAVELAPGDELELRF